MTLDLNIMQSNEKVYVLVEAPHLVPGLTYAWTPYLPHNLTLVSVNGVPTPGADTYYYAGGPIPEVPIKNLYLRGLSGKLLVRTQVGENLANSREIQRVEVNVSTPVGDWQITELFLGGSFTYDGWIFNQITSNGLVEGYSAVWGPGAPAVVAYGDTRTHLYRVQFSHAGFAYHYDIVTLTSTEMFGRWGYAGIAGASLTDEDFWGQKILSIQ
jgi:hypothetical protein